MRRLLTLACDEAELGATLDAGGGGAGLLMVTGGSQTRIGSHRMYERLASALARRGISCLRFDRRGVGDSGGEDPGFRGSGPDIAAAAALLRAQCPRLDRLYGVGLCDGATALALFGHAAGLDGLILVNPWLVESEAGIPPPAAIRRHYRRRLLSRDGWRKVFSNTVDYHKLFRGLVSITGRRKSAPLAREVAEALARHGLPARVILATGDATAVAAAAEMRAGIFKGLAAEPRTIDSDSHTFARSGDDAALLQAVADSVDELNASR